MNWDFSVVWDNLGALQSGFIITLSLTLISIAVGTTLGLIMGVLVISSNIYVRLITRAYIEIFLALPVLVIIIWLYYVAPQIHSSLTISGYTSALIGLGLSLSAFVAEIVRAGIGTIPTGELESAYCLGLNKYQSLRFIIFPQAMRKMWPPLMGQYITCYKMSTLASVVAVNELLHTSNIIISETYQPLEIYTAIAVIFILTVIPVNILFRKFYDSDSYIGIKLL